MKILLSPSRRDVKSTEIRKEEARPVLHQHQKAIAQKRVLWPKARIPEGKTREEGRARAPIKLFCDIVTQKDGYQ